jgi:hypothetical protein
LRRKKNYPFDAPAESAGKKHLLLIQIIVTFQQLIAIDHREPTVKLSYN